MIPIPPEIFSSIFFTGGGLRISNILKRIKAAMRYPVFLGRNKTVRRKPQNSSITICLLSFPRTFSAFPDVITPIENTAMKNTRSTLSSGFMRMTKTNPTAEQNVPGAYGM